MQTTATTTTGSRSNGWTSGALLASAFVIMALIIVEAGHRNSGPRAFAGDVAEVADLTVLTAAAGDADDVLCVLDQRNETLSVYGIEQGRTLQMYQLQDLREGFTQARGAVTGGR